MNYYAEKNLLSETTSLNGVSYTLSDENMLDQTKFMVMNDQHKDQFIRSARSRYNGKTKITYFVSGLTPLSDLIAQMTPDKFVAVVLSIFNTVNEIMETGFFKAVDIDASLNKIFVDTGGTLAVKMVCLPINYKYADSDGKGVMYSLRSDLLNEMQKSPRLHDSSDVKMLHQIVANPNFDIKSLCKEIVRTFNNTDPGKQLQPVLRCTNYPLPEIRVSGSPFSIGRKYGNNFRIPEEVAAVSREHCEIRLSNGRFCIVDKGSTHGTRLNNMPLQAMKPYALSNGDSIMIANLSFEVKM